MTIASNAAFAAAARGGPLAMADLMAAATAEFRKLDRDPAELAW
jgi:predicted nucleic acid-binding protein